MQEPALTISNGLGDLARQKLREAIAIYGRAAFQEPRRCEAILRDCCPTAPREVFLLVSALRENVAEELVTHEASLPPTALVTRLARRLSDHLGLSEDSARWAVDSWRYGLEDNPGLRAGGDGLRLVPSGPWAAGSDSGGMLTQSAGGSVNWPWLGMCLITVVSAVVALAAMGWVTFVHWWTTWQESLLECAALAAVLAGCAFGGFLAGRSFEQILPPDRRALDPRRAPYALLPEALILVLLPLVAGAVPVLWVAEWWLGLHLVGAAHGAWFHVIRGIESLWVAAFLYSWVRGMIGIQRRVAGSLIPPRR